MNIDEDLVARLIGYKYVGFVVGILELELRELQRVLCHEPNGGQVLNKLLHVRCVELVLVGSLD